MLKKGAVQKAKDMKGQFLGNLFLVSKKGGGNRPVVNLKNLNFDNPILTLQHGEFHSFEIPTK